MKELASYYEEVDVTALYFENNIYTDIAMSIKLFEYIGYGVLIIANSGTAAAEFIEKYDIGWVFDYDNSKIKMLLK